MGKIGQMEQEEPKTTQSKKALMCRSLFGEHRNIAIQYIWTSQLATQAKMFMVRMEISLRILASYDAKIRPPNAFCPIIL